MSTPKRHHYVPEWILRRVARDGVVHQLDRTTGRAVGMGPQNAAVIGQFYRLSDEVPIDDPVLPEKVLSVIEGAAEVVWSQIEAGQTELSPEDQYALSQFLAVAYLRSPLRRQEMLALGEAAARMWTELQYRYPDRELREKHASELLEEIADELAQGNVRIVPTDDHAIGWMFDQSRRLAFTIAQMKWVAVRSPVDLLVGDSCVTVYDPDQSMPGTALLSSASSQTVITFGADRALMLLPTPAARDWEPSKKNERILFGGTNSPKKIAKAMAQELGGRPRSRIRHMDLTADQARELNLRVAAQADRWIIGPTRESVDEIRAQIVSGWPTVSKYIAQPTQMTVVERVEGAENEYRPVAGWSIPAGGRGEYEYQGIGSRGALPWMGNTTFSLDPNAREQEPIWTHPDSSP